MTTLFTAAIANISPNVTLNNGLSMPRVSFAANVWAPDTCQSATSAALDVGFRFVWSSALIGSSCQTAQRAAIDAHPTVHRKDLFLAGTVNSGSCQGKDGCYTATMSGAEAQFNILGPEPLDMIMLDYPTAYCDGIQGQWKAFTELYNDKKVKSIAVSNFGEFELGCLFPAGSNALLVSPVANQMHFCVGDTDETNVTQNAELGIVVQAYSPLNSGGLVHDPLVIKIGTAHNRSASQVALRYILQKNVTVATQSTNPAYLAEDIDLFSWSLTASEMARLDAHTVVRKTRT